MNKMGGGDVGHEKIRAFEGVGGYLQGSPSS